MISTQVKLDNGKLLSLKPANLEVQRKPKLEDRIKESQQRALRRAEERRIADAKREEAAAAREAVHPQCIDQISLLACSTGWRCGSLNWLIYTGPSGGSEAAEEDP